MLQIQRIRDHQAEVLTGLEKRGKNFADEVQRALHLDDHRKTIQTKLDNLLSESNRLAKEIGELYQAGKASEAGVLKEKANSHKGETTSLKDELASAEEALHALLCVIPNVPHDSVKSGKSAEDNECVFQEGTIPALKSGEAKPHWELAEQYRLIDFELGTKISGAGFPVYMGKGARLQRGLINFFLDRAVSAGYAELMLPHLVNEDSGFGTGQLPDKEGQMYHVGVDNLYLIPTAEVPITNLYRDVLLREEHLPLKMCGYTPCFRREAGSYGKDVRGLNRLHQFDKVEIVRIEHPEGSYAVLDEMVNHVKSLLRELELPFRILRLCGGDMGFTSALTYDFEVYSAAQERWLEVSSVSNFETFQSNRLKCRFKDSEGRNRLTHTLNGSALALPRIVAALLENHQDNLGIKIPNALAAFTGFDRIDI